MGSHYSKVSNIQPRALYPMTVGELTFPVKVSKNPHHSVAILLNRKDIMPSLNSEEISLKTFSE